MQGVGGVGQHINLIRVKLINNPRVENFRGFPAKSIPRAFLGDGFVQKSPVYGIICWCHTHTRTPHMMNAMKQKNMFLGSFHNLII